MGDFEREILSESPPSLGGWGAEVLNNEAEKLHRIHVRFRTFFMGKSDQKYGIAERWYEFAPILENSRTFKVPHLWEIYGAF